MIIGAAVIIGSVYAWQVTPGLPYDEAAHWSVVQYIADTYTLPDMRDLGVGYEAQQGPVAYVLGAVVTRLFQPWGGETAAFYAVRVLGGLELAATAGILFSILRRLEVSHAAAAGAVATFALNPMLVAMFWSVQNDGAMLVLGCLALRLALSSPDSVSPRRSALIGALAGLALLTKLTAAPLFVGYLIWLTRRSSSPGQYLLRVVPFLFTAFAMSGWWFILNLTRYNTLTPPTDLNGGPSFPAYGIRGLGTILHLAQSSVAYVWVPNEYFRNLIGLPLLARVLIAAITAAIVVLAAIEVRSRVRSRFSALASTSASAWQLIGITGAVAALAWVVVFLFVSAVAPRFAYMALPLWFAAIALAIDGTTRRLGLASGAAVACALPVVAIALNVWVIGSLSDLQVPIGLNPLR